jgi:hypothetical protein
MSGAATAVTFPLTLPREPSMKYWPTMTDTLYTGTYSTALAVLTDPIKTTARSSIELRTV